MNKEDLITIGFKEESNWADVSLSININDNCENFIGFKHLMIYDKKEDNVRLAIQCTINTYSYIGRPIKTFREVCEVYSILSGIDVFSILKAKFKQPLCPSDCYVPPSEMDGLS